MRFVLLTKTDGQNSSGGDLTRAKLAALLSCCCLFVILGSFAFQTRVMPHLDDSRLSLRERMRSDKFGDTYEYGRLAEGILRYRELVDIDRKPIVKHMPALPLSVAASFNMFGSLRPLLIFQILFLFLSLFFLLDRLRGQVPAVTLVITPVLIALHPETIKHSAAVMSDLTFGSLLLWVVFLLSKRPPGYRDFAGAGAVFGVAVYLREAAFPLMLMTVLAYVACDYRRYAGPAALMAGVFLAILSPWVIRNQQVTQKFVPLTTKTADLFYYYSIPLTADIYMPFGPGFQEGGYQYVKLYEAYNNEAETRGLSPRVPAGRGSNASSENYTRLKGIYESWRDRPLPSSPIREGLRNYASRPKEQLVSIALKTIALFNKPQIFAELAVTSLSSLLAASNVVFYGFHIAIIIFGVFLSFTRQNHLFVFLPYWITGQYVQSLFLWSEHRYLMPFYPLLILLSICWYWKRWRAQTNNWTILDKDLRGWYSCLGTGRR